MSINFTEGLDQALLASDVPVITDYEFFLLGQNAFNERYVAGEALKRLPPEWDHFRSRRAMTRLLERNAIVPDADFKSGVWRVVQATRAGSAEEVSCIADPFCYVSHLSAMQRYGLTDRSPAALHLTTPARLQWNALRDLKIQEDGVAAVAGRPPLLRLGFKETIRRRPVVLHESSHPAVPTAIRGEQTRITTIGRTFADMLSEPQLCGGMHHVIDIWKTSAEDWAPQIMDEIERFEAKIVKVRAGYLMSEILGIKDSKIESWQQHAQRGGSRKLDPDAPYAPVFSERWMISINV